MAKPVVYVFGVCVCPFGFGREVPGVSPGSGPQVCPPASPDGNKETEAYLSRS